MENGSEANETQVMVSEIEAKKLEYEAKKIAFWQEVIGKIVPQVLSYVEQRMVKHDTPIAKTGLWIIGTIVFLIIGGTGTLVFNGKLDAASFTLVIGTVLGYLLSFSKVFLKKDGE